MPVASELLAGTIQHRPGQAGPARAGPVSLQRNNHIIIRNVPNRSRSRPPAHRPPHVADLAHGTGVRGPPTVRSSERARRPAAATATARVEAKPRIVALGSSRGQNNGYHYPAYVLHARRRLGASHRTLPPSTEKERVAVPSISARSTSRRSTVCCFSRKALAWPVIHLPSEVD